MIQRINQYLRTHHPLLWNTRVVWVLLTNVALYLLFFLAGFITVQAREVAHYYSVWFVGGFGLPTISVLCTLLVLVGWLLYYLRNNAFKNFYRIGRFHLLREFLLLLIILFSSTIYYEFFVLGVRARVGTFTTRATFRQEVSDLNRGLAFIPINKANYFIFNSCAAKGRDLPEYNENNDYARDNDQYTSDSSYRMIADALRRPDAFTYRNYCRLQYAYLPGPGNESAETVAARTQSCIDRQEQDSIRQMIGRVVAICRKYGVGVRLNTEQLVRAPFLRPFNAVPAWVPDAERDFHMDETEGRHPYYLEKDELNRAVDFILDCQSDFDGERFLVIAYACLGVALLLLTWRRFSRRVFLVAVIGALLWPILIALLGYALEFSEQGFYWFMILLTVAFGVAAWLRLQRPGPTAAGALLAWHSWLFPSIGLLLLGLNSNYLSHGYDGAPSPLPNGWIEAHYPTAWWIKEHQDLLAFGFWIIAVLYIAFVVNALARRWQALPQE